MEYLSNLSKRGATFYESFQVIPIFAIELFYPRLEIINSSLNYKLKLSDHWTYKTRFNLSATGDRPMYKTGEPLTDRNERATTHEWDHFLELGIPQRGEFTLQVSQDLRAHNGTYLEGKVRAVLMNIPFKKLKLQPALFASIGMGSKNHNQYLYGVGADTFSANHFSTGFSVSTPPALDVLYPVLEAKYYQILGDGNRRGHLVTNKAEGWRVIALAAIELWKL